jgi:hypothetical protein
MALASRSELARAVLAELGLNDCEASELLDEPRRDCGLREGCLNA